MADREENILLVGYRGTGKSTLGKHLAAVLDMAFVDMDRLIIEEAGCSISSMVKKHGWPHFRELEKKILVRLSQGTGQVIATGGGAVLDAENRMLLRKMGSVVWLKADPDRIVERLKQDTESAAQRPAFSDRDLLEETKAVLKERTPIYASISEITVDTSTRDIRECIDEIVRIIHIKKENQFQNV